MFSDILCRLRDVVRRNSPKSGVPAVGIINFSPSRLCSSTGVGVGQGFLSEYQHWSILHIFLTWLPLISNLFPRLKLALKGRRCCDATDIENATEELKMLSLNGFQGRLKNLQSPAEVHICTRGLFLWKFSLNYLLSCVPQK